MPVTAPISLTKIKTEFTGPDNFGAYIRGGTYVPNVSANNSISTTVNGLAMSTFLNATKVGVSLPSWNSGGGYDNNIVSSYIDTICNGASASIYLYVNSNGTMVYNDSLANYSHTWLQVGTASELYFRFDVTSGDTPILSTSPGYGDAAVGSNLQMNTNYFFALTATVNCNDPPMTKATFGTWSFRDASNNVLVSQTFAMEAYAQSN